MTRSNAKKIDPATVGLTVDPTVTEAAYRKYRAAAIALRSSELANPSVNVTTAVAIATAGAGNVLLHREEVDARVKKVPWSVIERVAEVGLAAQHADMLVRLQDDEASAFGDVLPELDNLRGILLGDLDLLVRRKKVPAKVPADIRSGENSVHEKANDLRDLVAYFTAQWPELSGHTSIKQAELTAADALSTKVLARLGALHVARVPKDGELTAADMRRRTFTLLERDYDVARQHGAFVFWSQPEGWEAYVPSLWAGRRRSAGAAEAETPVTEPVAEPVKKPA
jgi:hypothetical protein